MSFLADIFGAGDAEERGAELDAKLAEINTRDYIDPNGKYYSPDAARIVSEHLNAQQAETADFDASLDREFIAGLAEGRDNVKGAFNGAVWQLLKSVPFVVWVALAVYLFWFFGGWRYVKGKIGR